MRSFHLLTGGMMEPEIKLFGKKITLPGGDAFEEKADEQKQLPAEEDQVAQVSETEMQEKDQDQVTAEEKQNPTVSSELDQNPSIDEDSTSENNPKPENEQTDATNGKQKPLKKPDKILPCPRCNSMDTKFCYYNNYNVNQPRHFCKGCQRYWTAGGTIRNVPVGAGRRKNKNSESLQAGQVNRFHHHTGFKPNGSVLSFEPDTPLCESMASGLNLAENRDDNSVAQIGENCPQEQVMTNMNNVAVPYPVPCIPGVAWPFPTLPLPAICPPAGYPMPFYPAPYWNCGMPNAWNVVPWVSPPSPSANRPNSPLGKHSRNGELLKVNGSDDQQCLESSIVVPKTLRIDDPEEAAKSSIWETLGIKYDSVSREGLFKALQPKGDEKKVASPAALHANPAALSRSISFRESA